MGLKDTKTNKACNVSSWLPCLETKLLHSTEPSLCRANAIAHPLGRIDDARGAPRDRAGLLIDQDAVDTAGCVVETRGCAGRAAPCTTASCALEGAASCAVGVSGFEARESVAAGRLAWN